MSARTLWTITDMTAAMRATARGTLPEGVSGLSIDSRTIKPGEAYFAIKGDVHDGHAFVMPSLAAGAGVAVVARNQIDHLPDDARLLIVDDVLAALVDLAIASRARSQARIIAVTGSVGKTSTKEALRVVLSSQGETHVSAASFNNHWGVPLSLARCPAGARYAVFEIGMNHAGEIEPLVKMVRPHIAIVTTVEPVHLEFFKNVQAIADAKAEIFTGVEPDGVAIVNRDNPQFTRLSKAAKAAGIKRIISFGENPRAEARLLDVALHADCSAVRASILGHDVTYKIGMPGRHMAMNSLAVLAAASLAGADLALAGLSLSQLAPPSGRGERQKLALNGGEALLIDESYNANPASMAAALNVLGRANAGPNGRRIAVLGDMLELGPTAPKLHAGLAEAVKANGIDSVFCCGPLMRHLWDALSTGVRGGYAETSSELESQVAGALRAGDAVMVKGSLGSKMKIIVTALARRFPESAAHDDVAI